MTTYYVDDGGSQTAPYDTYAKAETTLAALIAAVTPFTAGDEIHIGHDHAESTAGTVTFAFAAGTELQPIRVISTNTGSDAYQAGASIAITGVENDLNISTGASVWYGVTLTVADNLFFIAEATTHRFVDCVIVVADLLLVMNANWITLEFVDSALSSADATANEMRLSSATTSLIIRGGSVTMGSAGSGLPIFVIGAGDSGNHITVEDCDLSGCTSDLVLVSFNTGHDNRVIFRRCKLPSAYTLPATPTAKRNRIEVESCSGGTSTKPFLGVGGVDGGNAMWRDIKGDVRTATAQHRNGGASDGVNDYSWEMTANANVSYFSPLESPSIVYWAEPGSQTVTIYTANDADLNDNELWMVVEHPDTATPANPDHIVLSNTKPNPLATPGAVARDAGSTWDGAGTGTDGAAGQQKLVSSSFNPVEAGPVIIRVYLAKASTTMYVDPKPAVA